MKNISLILILIILFSCDKKTKKDIELIDLSVSKIDSLNANGKLTKKIYPDMSVCGGALDGYYYKTELVLIDAIYSGELGYLREIIYLNNSKFIKIIYQEHFQEMKNIFNKNSIEKSDFKTNNLTFTDTIYEIKLGKNIEFKKTFKNRVLSTEIDLVLIKKLTDCGEQMKMELETIKE